MQLFHNFYYIHPEKIQRHLRVSTTMHSPRWLYSMSCLKLLFTETLDMFIRSVDSWLNHSFESGIFNESVHQYFFDPVLKGLVHPKMKILSLITHPYVIPNPTISSLQFQSSMCIHDSTMTRVCIPLLANKAQCIRVQSQNAGSASAAPHTCVMVLSWTHVKDWHRRK